MSAIPQAEYTDEEILAAWSQSGPSIINESTMLARFRAFLAALPNPLPDKVSSRNLDVEEEYQDLCARLRKCVEKHGLGLGGERLSDLVCDYVEAQANMIAELDSWKESMMVVEREWDSQAIAKMLGGLPGQSCRKVIAQRVPELLAELAALRQVMQADDGRSLGRVAFEAAKQYDENSFFSGEWVEWEEMADAKEIYEAAAQAVASVVLSQAIRRMEAVSHSEITNAYWQEGDGCENIRARLLAAARGETEQQADSTDLREALKIANESADEQMRYKREAEARAEKAEAERKKWEEDALRYCKNADYWKSQAETIGILRPLAQAGPVPDGCVRVTALKNHEDEWAIGDSPSQRDTHFADLRLPKEAAQEVEPSDSAGFESEFETFERGEEGVKP